MIPVPRRKSGLELLDLPSEQDDDAEFAQGMADIRAVNRFLGGTRSVLKHVPALAGAADGRVSVLDISTGTGDIPAAISKWAMREGVQTAITAVDINERVVRNAARHVRDVPRVRLVCGDAFKLPFREKSFDIVVCSLTLHHFTEEDAVKVIKTSMKYARRGIIIGDLRRSWVPFFLFRAISGLFLRNRFTRHDGPLSIMKSFTPDELEELAGRAGLKEYRISMHPFWRMTLVAKG